MADWRMTGAYFKSCNGESDCPCDFMSAPTYHHCEGGLGMRVETGHFDNVSFMVSHGLLHTTGRDRCTRATVR